jgi:hypothetical protein
MKNLIFEGAGCEWKETEINNHRIRTRIKNREGRIIYLEMTGSEQNSYKTNPFKYTAFVTHCFYFDVDSDRSTNYSKELKPVERKKCEYTKKGVISFVNSELNCDFEDLTIDESLNVHETEKELCSC